MIGRRKRKRGKADAKATTKPVGGDIRDAFRRASAATPVRVELTAAAVKEAKASETARANGKIFHAKVDRILLSTARREDPASNARSALEFAAGKELDLSDLNTVVKWAGISHWATGQRPEYGQYLGKLFAVISRSKNGLDERMLSMSYFTNSRRPAIGQVLLYPERLQNVVTLNGAQNFGVWSEVDHDGFAPLHSCIMRDNGYWPVDDAVLAMTPTPAVNAVTHDRYTALSLAMVWRNPFMLNALLRRRDVCLDQETFGAGSLQHAYNACVRKFRRHPNDTKDPEYVSCARRVNEEITARNTEMLTRVDAALGSVLVPLVLSILISDYTAVPTILLHPPLPVHHNPLRLPPTNLDLARRLPWWFDRPVTASGQQRQLYEDEYPDEDVHGYF